MRGWRTATVLLVAACGCGDSSVDDGPPRCVGVPVPCEVFGGDGWTCGSQNGCGFSYRDNSCYGEPTACADHPSEARCFQQAGCWWTTVRPADTPPCTGVATPCSMLRTTEECLRQTGCSWDRWTASCVGDGTGCVCHGEAWGCARFEDRPTCEGEPGCAWDGAAEQCSGRPESCESYPTARHCMGDFGCSWY